MVISLSGIADRAAGTAEDRTPGGRGQRRDFQKS